MVEGNGLDWCYRRNLFRIWGSLPLRSLLPQLCFHLHRIHRYNLRFPDFQEVLHHLDTQIAKIERLSELQLFFD